MLHVRRPLRVIASLAAVVALTACDRAPRDLSPWSRALPDRLGGPLLALALDPEGEPAFTGVQVDDAQFSPALPTVPAQGLFVSMLSDTGEDLWGGTNRAQNLYGRNVAVTKSGDVLLLGTFQGDLELDGHTIFTITETTFLARFDPRGKLLWSKVLGGEGDGEAFGLSLTTSAAGDAVIGGFISGAVDFGGGPLLGDAETSFVARFDENGKHLWSRALQGGYHQVTAVAIDEAGAVIAAGNGSGDLGFDAGESQGSGQSSFVAKLSSGGEPVFMTPFLGADFGGYPTISGVAVDPVGDIVFSGGFAGTVTFAGTQLSSIAGQDAFVARLSPAGTPLWLRNFPGGSGSANAVAVAPNGRIYAAGYYVGEHLDVGGLRLGPVGGSSTFLAELDAAGTVTDARVFAEGTQVNTARALAVDPQGALVIGGSFVGDIEFDDQKLTSDAQGSSFLARLALPFASHRRE